MAILELNKIYCGDCLETLKAMPDNSIDSVVTDPPYELTSKHGARSPQYGEGGKKNYGESVGGFMGMKWDATGIAHSVELWQEVLRVLKPGGHLLSFGGTRTYHRMACAIEDAGFEIRDQIMWIYGSGFPKSMNISKVIDGWGTALKPAHEPLVVARKPLSEKTVANNVLRWGTGGINIEGCRVGNESLTYSSKGIRPGQGNYIGDDYRPDNPPTRVKGRFPANIILDEEAGRLLDDQSGISKSTGGRANNALRSDQRIYGKGKDNPIKADPGFGDFGGASRFFYCAKASQKERNSGLEDLPTVLTGMSNGAQIHGEGYNKGQGIGLNRVIPRKNNHPTVKPISLMRYLVRLVTPPGGIVLDPFTGSGTTLIASKLEGFSFVGIEKEQAYCDLARKRIEATL